MIVIISALVGGLLGTRAARKRNGNRLDIAQYAVAYGIAFALVGLIVTVIIDRMF